MMRPIALLGLIAGGVLAAGNLTAAQWHAAGVALLALIIAHGLTALPWLLVALATWRYWRWKRTALAWIGFGKHELAQYQQRKDQEWSDLQAKIRQRTAAPQRKRARR